MFPHSNHSQILIKESRFDNLMFPRKKYVNPYYWTCPFCQANLDLNEKCDCPESQGIDADYSDVKPTHPDKGGKNGTENPSAITR